MSINYAYQSGSFKALTEMMSHQIRKLDSADEIVREVAIENLQRLADQADRTLAEFGYKETL